MIKKKTLNNLMSNAHCGPFVKVNVILMLVPYFESHDWDPGSLQLRHSKAEGKMSFVSFIQQPCW